MDGLSGCPIETNQKLPERFVTTPNQHCWAAILIGSGGDTANIAYVNACHSQTSGVGNVRRTISGKNAPAY